MKNFGKELLRALSRTTKDKSINIGRDATESIIITGDGNVVFTTFEKVSLPPSESVDIGRALEGLLQELRELALKQEGHSEIAQAMEKATEEAEKNDPDRNTIGSHVEKALDVAKTANNFVEVCKLAGPHVTNVAAWLGQNWHTLLPLVGLSL